MTGTVGEAARALDPRGGQRVVLVTGASGAGRSTAIHALEDFGFEVIDNLPLSLVPRLLQGPPPDHPLALGIDVRTRGFSAGGMVELIDALTDFPGLAAELLYLDCRNDVLVHRYSETRRRHPLVDAGTGLVEGIDAEIALLAPVRERADVLIDTSDLTVHELKAELSRWLGLDEGEALSVSVQSFSYKRGVPRGLDLVFDVRFLRNPHWEPALRALDGRDSEVAAYVAGDERYAEFRDRICGLIEFLLPAYAAEGKAHLAIGFGCSGGHHRSVALAETVAKALAEAGWRVSIRHRELDGTQHPVSGEQSGGRAG
jgi:UPF0042 nucleotide-binding protein